MRALCKANHLELSGWDKDRAHKLEYRSDRDEQLRRDKISHYVLRLAFCRTEEQRRWLLSQEW